MVYRVGDNEISTYDYSSRKISQPSEDTEKFKLPYEREDKESEEKKARKDSEEKKSGQAKPPMGTAFRKDGVRLEISGGGLADIEKQKAENAAGEQVSVSLLQSVKDFFSNVIKAVKDILDKIWNEPPEQEISENQTEKSQAADSQAAENMRAEETEKPSITEKERDAQIQKYLHRGNLEQVISLLTDDGQRTIAKNSSLLTYYDKSGKITQINASDRERILHGDRNVKRL